MNPDEAAIALDNVSRTRGKLAELAQWPVYRHAMFGLCEGLLIAGLAQPSPVSTVMFLGAMVLLVACIADDRRRHGMFVSGWQKGATLPLMIALVLFLGGMALAAIAVRDGDALQPLGFGIGLFTLAVCTLGSLAWERIYRAQLLRKDQP